MSTSTPTQTDPRPRTTYPLTWLRGLAALAVVTFHAYQHNRTGANSVWPWSGAAHRTMLGTELFVEMFFVLSGFVLWLPVARDGPRRRGGPPGLGGAVPPDGATDAALLRGRAAGVGRHQPRPARPLAGPACCT